MYGKYSLFYESPKKLGILRACLNSVYRASPWGGEAIPTREQKVLQVMEGWVGPVNEAKGQVDRLKAAFSNTVGAC